MPPLASGCLVVRQGPHGPEVLLVHARRASFHRPLFGIPKGAPEAGENLEATAVRETLEETGLRVCIVSDLGTVRQASGKIVHAFLATVAPDSRSAIDADGRCRTPDDENDVCRFYSLDEARAMMIPAQREFLDRIPPSRRGSGPVAAGRE